MKKYVYNTALILITIILIFTINNILKKTLNIESNKADITKLKSENIFLKEQLKEYTKYNDYLEIEHYSNIFSKIIFRNIYDYNNQITITANKNEEIQNNMAAINEYGLIGITKNSNKNQSDIQLLTNKNTEISVKIKDAYGILKSDGTKLYVTNITKKIIVSQGDSIYTSGIGVLPDAILIGSVKEVKINNLEIELILNERTDLHDLKYIAILKKVVV